MTTDQKLRADWFRQMSQTKTDFEHGYECGVEASRSVIRDLSREVRAWRISFSVVALAWAAYIGFELWRRMIG
jgi:hypothetical protein